MSLYADEDLALYGPSSSSGPLTAGPSSLQPTTINPAEAFVQAITLPAESQAQADGLTIAADQFEQNPEGLPVLCAQLLPMVVDGQESLIRSWTLDMVLLAVGRSRLEGRVKEEVAQTSLSALLKLLASDSPATLKPVISIFACIYPILFRILATSRPSQTIIDAFQQSKTRILALALDHNARPQNVGVKAVAWKYCQRVMAAGTRTGAVDPRLAKSANPSDPSVSIITRDSALSAPQLEEEALMLRNQLVTQLFTSDHPALLHAIISIIPLLCKTRPSLAPAFVTSITSWTPAALEAKGRSGTQIRAVEKTLRSVMAHLVRIPALTMFSVQLNDALSRQKSRLEVAWETEQRVRRAKRAAAAEGIPPSMAPTAAAAMEPSTSLGKHGMADFADAGVESVKRQRVDLGTGKGHAVDISRLGVDEVVDMVMSGLAGLDGDVIARAFDNARRNLEQNNPDATPLLLPTLGMSHGLQSRIDIKEEKDEVLNPLDMDVDDDDLLADDESETDEPITFADFTLPPPEPLDPSDRDELVQDILKRIVSTGQTLGDGASGTDPWSWLNKSSEKDGVKTVVDAKEMWMVLLSRLATRVAVEEQVKTEEGAGGLQGLQKRGRERLAEVVAADFANRSKFAALWLNEEWYTEKLCSSVTPSYTSHVISIITAHLAKLDPSVTPTQTAKSLSLFFSSIPEVPLQLVQDLADLCQDADKAIVGFLTLRDLVETRPPTRQLALKRLLDLCVHGDRKVRVLAISTVRRWVPGHAVSGEVVKFAEQVLDRLNQAVFVEEGEEEVKVEPTDELSPFLQPPSNSSIQQHVELPFALSRRYPHLLDSIFALYPTLPTFIQGSYEDLLVPLIQSLSIGPTTAAPGQPMQPSEKLMNLLKEYPAEGTEKLVLRVISTLSKEGKAATVRDLVRGWVEQKGEEVDVRFVIPVLGELTRPEIEAQIPRIVSLLQQPDSRDTVRTAFATLIQKLTPADLLVALHNESTALKPTIEAIGICFSMTTVFRSDVLVASMVRIADLPNGSLPIVFMRTIIQAVTTYKSLIPFVANTILPKLVGKKIWSAGPQLWDGFVRLAKLIAPASYGVLLQLPKEWLKDVLEKQPGLKSGLKTFLAGKQGGRGVLVELFAHQP